MEKYFVTQITKTNDSEVYAIATTPKDSKTEAKALYHQILASVYATPNIEHAIVKIDNYYGNTEMKEVIINIPPSPEVQVSEP